MSTQLSGENPNHSSSDDASPVRYCGPTWRSLQIAGSGPSGASTSTAINVDDPIELASGENLSSDLSTLEDMFPCYCKEQLEYIYELNGKMLSSTMDCLLNGIDAECICSLLGKKVLSSDEIVRIRVDSIDENSWLEAALCHY